MGQSSSRVEPLEALLPEISVQLFDAGQVGRNAVEGFIRKVFYQSYQAEVSLFLPRLMSMQRSGKIEAALGIASASTYYPLFLECYLDSPVEQVLAEHYLRPIHRQQIVEVGNLAAVPPGAARYLFIALTAYLKGAGIDWAVFTAVPRVINSFSKLGISLQTLAEANIERLPASQTHWGSYYQNSPQVVGVEVDHSVERMCYLLERMNSAPLQQLWGVSLQAGKQSCLPVEIAQTVII